MGLIILLNKWDALDEEQREWTEQSLPERFGFVSWAPALRMAALTGSAGQQTRWSRGSGSSRRRETRVPTGQLNRSDSRLDLGSSAPCSKGASTQDPLRRPGWHSPTDVRDFYIRVESLVMTISEILGESSPRRP